MFPSVIPLPNPIYGPCVRSSSFGDIFSHIGDIQTLLVIQAEKQAACSLTGPGIRSWVAWYSSGSRVHS